MGGRAAAAVLVVVVLVGCSDGSPSDPVALSPSPTTPPAVTTPTTLAPTTELPGVTTTPTTAAPPVERPRAADEPAALAAQIVEVEQAVRNPDTTPDELERMARLQQVVYRQLGVHPEWDAAIFAAIPAELHRAVELHTAARREFRSMVTQPSETLPPWRIVDPAPAADLLAWYREAEAAFGVGWQYLAAINLVETGMGRIHGLSTAGAQGPMQFMPATWERFGEGGDVNSPRDAILGAARYLAHNGFAQGNVDGALFNYNNDNRYVRGVKNYAQLMIEDPQAFLGLYNWQIVYLTVMGDVILPVGYEATDRIPVADYLAAHPQ